MESSSFLSLSSSEEEGICLICNKTFGRKNMADRNSKSNRKMEQTQNSQR